MILTERNSENRITNTLARLKEKGEKALVTFVTAGDPSLDKTRELVLAMEKAGADIIELGVPYSDPLADGPVIQQASQRALKAGVNLKKIFSTVSDLREETQIPILLMTYYNPLLKYGLAKVALDARASGIDGFIVPDLPMEEAANFSKLLIDQNIFLIPLVAPTSGQQRIKKITDKSKGFVYCVSLTGVTGIREGIPANLREFMITVRDNTVLPLAVGFGISTPEQVVAVSEYCDAVIVGSALVKTIGEKGNSADMVETVYKLVENLKKPLVK